MTTQRIPAADTIPGELRLIPQWVVAGRDKRPIDPHTGGAASTADPSTWGTFQQAVDRARRDRLGVGFVLTADTGIVGIDLDGCLDGDGNLSEDAAAIVARLNTYTERSRSGRGLHILAWSDALPGPGRKHTRRRVEVYQTGRYLIVTGDHYPGTPDTLEERTQAVAALYAELQPAASRPTPARAASAPIGATADDETILARLRRVPRFGPLWDGDTGAHGGDHSAADLSLLSLLAWAGATEAQADDLFRRSGLYRPKWDQRRGAATYGERTVAKAFADATVGDWTSGAPAERPGNDFQGSAPADAPAVPDNVVDLHQRLRELEAENARLRRENARLVAEVDRHRAIDRVAGNASLGATRTAAVPILKVIAPMTEPNAPDGAYKLNPYTLAESAGITPKTLRAQAKNLEALPLPDDVAERFGLPAGTPAWRVEEEERDHPEKPGFKVIDFTIRPSLPPAQLVEALACDGFAAARPGPTGRTPVVVEQALMVKQVRVHAETGEAVGTRVVPVKRSGRDGKLVPVTLPMDAYEIQVSAARVTSDGEMVSTEIISGYWPSFAPAADDPDYVLAVRAAETPEMISGAPGAAVDRSQHEGACNDVLGGNSGGVLPLPLMPPERGAPGDPARWLA